MKIQGIFFDLYGTILVYEDLDRSWDKWRNAFIDALARLGVTLDGERFDTIVSEVFGKPMLQREGRLTPYEYRIKEFIVPFGVDPSDADLGRIAHTSVEAWNEHISLDPEAVVVLEAIGRKKKTALISNFDYPPYIHDILQRYKLNEFFDHVTVSGEIGVQKPDPGVFAPALEATGLDAGATLFVGDSDEDVEGAQRAGITPVRIVRDRPAGMRQGVREIDRLSCILEYLA